MRNKMQFADRQTVERLRREFPKGCRIVLDVMDDPYTHIQPGAQGTCEGVDDAGNILCRWDCGSSLSVAYGADRAHRVASEREVKVSLDWLGKRQRGATQGGHCPRCGKVLDTFERHAVSRYADLTVCDECGTEEALECAGLKERKPLTTWWCTKGWEL
jgi:hypothetical protein